ncbi:MAG: YfiR family protein [Bacteroidetes bacterium]|nr:MAG: YfiR family protein [Bacteroidota bacterium]
MLDRLKNKSWKCIVGILTFLVCFFPNVFSSQPNNFDNHSQLIYFLTRCFEWPPQTKTGDFTIGVYNNDPAFESMSRVLADKRKERQQIQIKKIERIEDVKLCHMLYLPDANTPNFEILNQQAKNSSTLVITERPNALAEGSCLNFYTLNGKLRIELNASEIETREIIIHSDFIKFIEQRE